MKIANEEGKSQRRVMTFIIRRKADKELAYGFPSYEDCWATDSASGVRLSNHLHAGT